MNINFYEILCENNRHYKNPLKLKFYLEEYLFKGIDFKRKTLIDIGGGNGLFGFYAAASGAERVVVMEPEFDGSSHGIINEFYQIKSQFKDLDNIEHTSKVLEDYDLKSNKFDIILMHDSINHIDEEACIILQNDEFAQKKYLDFLQLLNKISNNDCKLIACDCSNKNFFNDIGIKNPIASSIEWEKHQPPEYWAALLKKVGFKNPKIKWTSPNKFGQIGRVIFGHSLGAYLTTSHFRLEMEFAKN